MLRVKNDAIWRLLRILFLWSALLFLINIYFGFDNALTPEFIPRWQSLIHLHSGSIGWITLSVIGIAIWVLTGDREVPETYEKRVRVLVWAAVISFAGYVPIFGFAYSGEYAFSIKLLPVFGSLAVLVLWASAIFAFSQLRKQSVLTTVHFLATGALLVAAVGATVGALLGLERAIGRQFLPIVDPDRVGAHAGMMDTYLFLVAGSIIEWFTRKDPSQRWTKAGLIQAGAWTVGAILVPIAFFLNLVEQIMPLFMLLLLLGLIIFLVRTAWGAIKNGPMAEGVKPWAFFGTLWLVVYMAVFLYAVSVFAGGGGMADLPPWYGAVFAHIGYVGMMTNLLLGVLSARTWNARRVLSWGESTSMWLINLGILVFLGLKIASDIHTGAIVMGIGVLLGVVTMILRLRASEA